MTKDLRYWDSDAFLGYFNEEPDKHEACEGVLAAADQGRLLIVTSALTLAEVLYAKPHPKLPKSKRADIEKFFRSPFITVQNVTRMIAEAARNIVWDTSVRPKDAIHVATAIHTKADVLNTFDKVLLSQNGKLGNPPLNIEKPYEPGQPSLPFDG